MRRIAHNNCVANGAKGWALVCRAGWLKLFRALALV
jgi:hypothetical protein